MEISKKKQRGPWPRVLLSSVLALAALCLAGPLMGCKDYDDDIDDLGKQISDVKACCDEANKSLADCVAAKEALKEQVEKLSEEKEQLEKELEEAEAAIELLQDPTPEDEEGDPDKKGDGKIKTPLRLSCSDIDQTLDVPGLASIGGVSIVNENQSQKDTVGLQTMYNVAGLTKLSEDLDCVGIADCKIQNGTPYIGEVALVSGETYACDDSGKIKQDPNGAVFQNADSDMLKNKSYAVQATGGPFTLEMDCGERKPDDIQDLNPEEQGDLQDNDECPGGECE